MNPIEYKITLDCRRAESQVIITAKQGEASGRKITFSLNEGRLPYKVPSGVTAVLRAKKPSGAVLYNTCTVTADGNVEYIITTQTVAEVGKLPCELQLSQDGKVIFSPNFTLLVYKNLSVDSEVESSDEFTALQAAISRAESLTDGTTFTPTVSEDGILSWTNDGGKANPAPVNIKGPQGEKGEDGIGGTFRINVTYSDGVYSADKTLSEIKAAYDAGQQPFVVQTDGTLDLVYTLASFDAPTDGSEPKFVDFERYLAGDGILETEMLRIYSYTTDSGSNVVKRIDEFKMPTSLKNPNALTFTGGATGSYDGSEPETVHIPVIPYEVINKNTAARHSHDNKTVLDGITAEKVTKWDDNAAGATFTPSVSADGTLSWTNDKGLTNPDPVNIKGPQGETGPQGPAGEPGKDGAPGSDATVTEESVTNALGYTPANPATTLRNTGWNANKNLGTDENGNVIEKTDIFSKDESTWSPVEYMNGVNWTEKGYYWTANGTHTSTEYTTNYQSTQELIRIEPGCSYTLSGFRGVYFLYDSTGKNGVASAADFDPNTIKTFDTNANQFYIGLSYSTLSDSAWTPERVSLVRNTISQTEYDALPTRADSLKTLYGKTIVCFGDSLFGMYRGDDSAPAFVAAETGATVHNVGFGGCRMSVHPTNGYSAFCMWALAKAIAENDWTTQDAQASSGSSYFPEHLALLKSIDFSTVDIAVIHYGTNDFGIGTGVTIDNTSDHDDYNTLCGALRYSIEKLLGAYPKLRIYVSLPVYRFWTSGSTVTYAETYTNANGNTLPEFVEALRNVAAEYNLPVIDGYYGLGINKANAAAFLGDGTHHNVTGRERFGRYIGQNLITQQTSGKAGTSGIDTDAVNALISAAIGNAIGGSY